MFTYHDLSRGTYHALRHALSRTVVKWRILAGSDFTRSCHARFMADLSRFAHVVYVRRCVITGRRQLEEFGSWHPTNTIDIPREIRVAILGLGNRSPPRYVATTTNRRVPFNPYLPRTQDERFGDNGKQPTR